MTRRVALLCAAGILFLLALFSWYMGGFFERYDIVVGESRHFAALAIVIRVLMLAFGAGAIWVGRKGLRKP